MKQKIQNAVFRFTRFWVRLFYPEITAEGVENLPDGPYITVGNHAKMNGPIACELCYPGRHYTWTAGKEEERKRISQAMMDGITELARALPEHIVVPYPNMPKRCYPSNKDIIDTCRVSN